MGHDLTSLLGNFIDWKDFEKFVAEMYKDSAEVSVQHDVTLVGKYGDKRQIDVLVTQKTKLHTYKTIIECKFLSTAKVDRPIIDVLAASIEDLNVNKGAIITTIGYEAGAIEYAKGKNIDIFLIRNVLNDEWGNTGKIIKFWLQTFSSQIENISFENKGFAATNGKMPSNKGLSLSINLQKDMAFDDEKHQLYSFTDLKKGPNLIKMLVDIREKLLRDLLDKTIGILENTGSKDRVFRTKAIFDLSNYPFKLFPYEHGYLILDKMYVTYLLSISETKFEHDRATNFNFVLMVENYITKQKNFVAKEKSTNNITLSSPVETQEYEPKDDLRNGGIIKILTDYYVGIDLHPDTKIEDINDVTINLQLPNNQN